MHGPVFTRAVIIALLIGSTACDIAMSSKLPPVNDDRILGEWRTTDDPESIFVKPKDGGYLVGSAKEFADGKETRFEIARVGKFLVAEISEPTCSAFDAKPCTFIHGVLEVTAGEVRSHQFDPEFIVRKSLANAIPFPHFIKRKSTLSTMFDTKVLLDGTPDQVSAALATWFQDRAAFEKVTRLVRVK
jgi:hypothetical protein